MRLNLKFGSDKILVSGKSLHFTQCRESLYSNLCDPLTSLELFNVIYRWLQAVSYYHVPRRGLRGTVRPSSAGWYSTILAKQEGTFEKIVHLSVKILGFF